MRQLIIAALCLIPFLIVAQQQLTKSAASIYSDIQKLNFLGSVLYVAAHPDDENNKMLSYLSKHKHAQTAYLSLTRGDGGQNLIGPEIRELLGVIRTQEMLAARRIDGADQFFSRANDFGFSKNPDETLAIWDKEKILEDVVWTIRKFKPDVIVNRFDHRNPGTTHGHHTAASILSLEAFDLSDNKSSYPKQLSMVEPHKVPYLFFNTSKRWYEDEASFLKVSTNFYQLDVGVFDPTVGKSNTEIAAEARSEHQCQGMGTTPTRGSNIEYLELLKGKPANKNDIFSGINTTWTRLEGGKYIGKILNEVEQDFNFKNPALSIAKLIEALKMVKQLPNSHWKNIKQKEIELVIVDCAGLFCAANTSIASTCVNDSVSINMEAINRSAANISLKQISIQPGLAVLTLNETLDNNTPFIKEANLKITNEINSTNAYWLNEKSSLGTYVVNDQNLIGLPETPRQLNAIFTFEIEGATIEIERPIQQKYTDPVVGEVLHPLEIVPEATVNIASGVYLFSNDAAQKIVLEIRPGKDNLSGTIYPGVANGWTANPAKIDFNLGEKGASQAYEFELYPTKTESSATLNPYVEINGKQYDRAYHLIDYNHIPKQVVLLKSTAKTVKLNIKTNGKNIAYIMGAGDVVPQNLEQIGYTVSLLNDAQISTSNLKQYEAVVVGIRAYNTRANLQFKHVALLNYVKEGGTLIIQYNTNHRLLLEDLGPYPLQLSRDRVTVEEAEVSILKPDHPLMNFPNKITETDFENWVQERGLYFPNEWDEKYEAMLSCHDPNEPDRKGGLLYAKYGEGTFIYTGYSWFRQLPAGVSGAFRIFANLLAGGKTAE